MKHIHSSFRACVSQAMRQLGVDWRYFLDECEYYEFLEQVDVVDDPRRIVVLALLTLCDGSARTIDKAVMVAVVEYLDGVLKPAHPHSKESRLRALFQRYPSDEHVYADWASLWYE